MTVFQASELADKSVIITGGTRGIGRACVDLFSADGADVTFFFRDSTETANEIVASGRAARRRITAEQVDVRDRKACEAAVERVMARCDRIDVLVNNSGVTRDNLLAMLEDDELQTVLDESLDMQEQKMDLLELADLFNRISALGEAERKGCIQILEVFANMGKTDSSPFRFR